jgi:glycosyltransferase involved in cell wall biosynthesis
VTTVGVALATYNGARFVERQVASILAQSRTPDRIVVTDDASDDDTVSRVSLALEQAVAGSDVDVIVTRNAERVGAVGNFERALRTIGTDVVFLCDQDDRWRPDKVASLLDVLLRDSKTVMAFSDGRLVDGDDAPVPGTVWDRTGFDERTQRHWLHGDPFDLLLRRTVTPGASMAIRHSLLTSALPLPHSAWHDDWLMLLATAGGTVGFTAEPLFDYRLHDSNAVGLTQESALDRLNRRTSMPRTELLARDVARLHDLQTRLDVLGLPERAARAASAQQHAQRRLDAAGAPLRHALGTVANGWRRGDYRAYSNGWRSAVADLIDGRLHRQVPTQSP